MHCITLGPQPVGVQCPLTSSLDEFGTGSGSGLSPVFVSIAFSPFALPILVFSIHSSPVVGFYTCFFLTTDISAPNRSTLHFADGLFPGLGLALVPYVVVQEAENGPAWVCMKQKSNFKFLPWPGFELRTSQPNGRERYY